MIGVLNDSQHDGTNDEANDSASTRDIEDQYAVMDVVDAWLVLLPGDDPGTTSNTKSGI